MNKRVFAFFVSALLICTFHSNALALAGPTINAWTYNPTPAEEQRLNKLSEQLRCVQCPNQSVADSEAPIAHDIRERILQLIRSGKNDAQIRDYFVARYGEVILYQPYIRARTYLLWFGPLILALLSSRWIYRWRKKQGLQQN